MDISSHLTPDEEEEGRSCGADNESLQRNPQLGPKKEGDKVVGKEHGKGEPPTLLHEHLIKQIENLSTSSNSFFLWTEAGYKLNKHYTITPTYFKIIEM